MKNSQSNHDHKLKIITAILAAAFCFIAAIGTVVLAESTAITDESIPDGKGEIKEEGNALFLSDKELSQIGTVLDETGISLMPDNFAYISYDDPAPTATDELLPSSTPEPQTTVSEPTYGGYPFPFCAR